jgi:zinc protease
MTDLQAATVEDVKTFFRTYYVPNNATLVIVGDFDPKQTKTWVEKYFGGLPRGKAIVRPNVPPAALSAEKRLTFEDRVQVPRLTIQWPSVSVHSEDQPALDLLSDILGNSRISRITKELVYDKRVATNVAVYQSPAENVGTFEILATPSAGHTLTELETTIDSIITAFKKEGPTAEELKRVKAGQELGFVSGLQSNLGKAFELAQDQAFFNDPSYSFRVEYPRTQAVTAADVKRVANKYLGPGRVVLSNVPLGKPDLASHADKSTLVTDPLTEKPGERKP